MVGPNNSKKVQLFYLFYSCLIGGLQYTHTDWWPVEAFAYLSDTQFQRVGAGSLT